MSQGRVLLVGAGYFAGFHAQAWHALGVDLAGVVDSDLQRAQALAADSHAPSFSDATQALCITQPTLIDVVLPPAAQASVVRACLAHGIPTICQKPFGADIREAYELSRLAKARGVPLVVHENFRFAPWFRECRKLIDAGHFGRLHGVSFRLRPGDGQGPDAYLTRQPYFQSQTRFLVRETGVHFIDSFRFLMGEVRWVWAHLRRLNPVIAGEDAALIHLGFDDDRTALFEGNRLNEHPAEDQRRTMGELWLEGERGVLRLDGQARLWWKPQGGPETQHVYGGFAEGPFGGAVQALQAHVLRHLDKGTPLENEATDYLPNLHVERAAYHSHQVGRRIDMADFDPFQP